MAASLGICPLNLENDTRAWRRSSTARLRRKMRNIEMFGYTFCLSLMAMSVLLLLRFALEGLGLAPGAVWGIGIINATQEAVGPFFDLFGVHPLWDLGAAVFYGLSAMGVRYLLSCPWTNATASPTSDTAGFRYLGNTGLRAAS